MPLSKSNQISLFQTTEVYMKKISIIIIIVIISLTYKWHEENYSNIRQHSLLHNLLCLKFLFFFILKMRCDDEWILTYSWWSHAVKCLSLTTTACGAKCELVKSATYHSVDRTLLPIASTSKYVAITCSQDETATPVFLCHCCLTCKARWISVPILTKNFF